MATDQEIIECAREGFDRMERRLAEIQRILDEQTAALDRIIAMVERRLDLMEG